MNLFQSLKFPVEKIDITGIERELYEIKEE